MAHDHETAEYWKAHIRTNWCSIVKTQHLRLSPTEEGSRLIYVTEKSLERLNAKCGKCRYRLVKRIAGADVCYNKTLEFKERDNGD